MTKILIIDDDKAVLDSLTSSLKEAGHQVFTAESGQVGLSIAKKQFPDLVILELVMPKMDGIETSHRLRELGIRIILVIGPANDERSVVKSLKMGADDYLPKPIEIPILQAKIRMLMRRNNKNNHNNHTPSVYNDGQLLIDLENRQVELRGQPIKLTQTEFRLLSILLRKVGRVVTHEDLIREVWGVDSEERLGSLKLYIHYLRRKLEDHPKKPYYLLAEWGIGYRLRQPQAASVSE